MAALNHINLFKVKLVVALKNATTFLFNYKYSVSIICALLLVIILAILPTQAESQNHNSHSTHEGKHEEGTAPETYAVLDLFSEIFEASIAGVGIKIAELKPKVENVNNLYQKGEKHEALAQVLGISTEVVVLGFLIETFAVGDAFAAALSFSNNWLISLGHSVAGVMASTKAALFAGEKVEEAAKEKYEHEIKQESKHHHR